ncbi:MAG: homocysteine S-methyltransferase family protein [Planctomycetota bacterium]
MDRSAWAAWFARGPVLLDGATGTELERRGAGCLPPLWSAAALRDAPESVAAIHRAYMAAGADILVANTFRTNPRTLARAGRLDEGPALCRRAVELARSAAAEAAPGRRVLVAASVAPVEDCYSPERAPDDAALQEEHRQNADWLAGAEPDLLWIETMGTAREARAAAEAAVACGLPCVVSFTARESGELLGGDPLEAACAAVAPFGPLALGLNCVPPRGVTELLPRLRRATAGPIAAYAHINNAVPTRGWSYAQAVTPEEYAQEALRWLSVGANIIGGCCGTTPAHIAALRGMLDAHQFATAR